MSRPGPRLARICLALAVLGAPRLARAYEEQWHFGGGIGAAKFIESDIGTAPMLGVHVAYDISDMFDLRLELGAAEHQLVESQSTRLYSAAAGVVYKLDVLEWVPYFGILGGYYAFTGGPWPAHLKPRELGVSVPLGLDYTLSRTFGLGVQVAYVGFQSDPLGGVGDAPYFTALLRAEYRLGW
ncbi:MAG: outer membrane beta-barrel protein [Myxococcales bacterium]|nr:outer membrane beta-barrel protein [Myxococcales bacterium]